MTTETAPAPIEIALDPAVLADIYDQLGHIEGQLPHFATKADVADLRAEMHTGFAELRADSERLRADMERLRADFERQLRPMTWTLVGVMLAGLTALAAFLKLWG